MSNLPNVGGDGISKPLPKHIAIIMDGNGRWAAKRGMPRTYGHKHGVQAVKRTVKACAELDIEYLTLYSFSSENWSRPKEEVSDLMGLLRIFIKRDLAELHENNVKIRVIGDNRTDGTDIGQLLMEAVELTSKNTGLNLTIAFSYGSRDEIIRAVKKIAFEAKSGAVDPDTICVDFFHNYLDTVSIPDPDLLIRTSGEQRISNFLLWQCAYTEFVFQDVHWPEYNKDYLETAIKEYLGRDRRYGGIKERSSA